MNFIEQLFGISPDAGSGLLEACLIAVPLGVLVLRAGTHTCHQPIAGAYKPASSARRIEVPGLEERRANLPKHLPLSRFQSMTARKPKQEQTKGRTKNEDKIQTRQKVLRE